MAGVVKPQWNWAGLDEAILKAITQLEAHGFHEPTIRSVYYVLGSLNLTPLTKYGYKMLDQKMTEMRKNKQIPWGFFAVKRGRSIEAPRYKTPEAHTEMAIDFVKKADQYWHLPRWFSQKTLIEVWVEKDGLLGAIQNWLSEQEVTCRAPSGYGAWEFIHSNMKDIMKEMEAQKKEKVVILYLGDLDPSGKDIPRFMNEDAIKYFTDEFKLDKIRFKEIALTPDQVTRYSLPEMPEADEVREKIEKDPRLKWYLARNPKVFCELDAFFALATDAAKQLLTDTVDGFFDYATYDATRKDEVRLKNKIKRLVHQRVEFKDKEEPTKPKQRPSGRSPAAHHHKRRSR